MTIVLNDGKSYIQLGDVLVDEKMYHIAKKISEYDENLKLICLEPGRVALADAPFMVVCENADGSFHKVLEAWEMDDRILERIWAADQHRFDSLTTIEAWEERNRKLAHNRYKEALAENHEILEAAIRNPKSSFTFENRDGEEVKVNDVGPVTRNRGKKSFS